MSYAIFPTPTLEEDNYYIVMSSDGNYYIDYGITRSGPYKSYNSAVEALLKRLKYKEITVASFDKYGNKL